MWTSSSPVVGGGVHGKGDGIARGTTVLVGAPIETSPLFIEASRPVGGMTIGSIVGKGIPGTPNECPTNKSKGTGATGKRPNIGRSKIIGGLRVHNLGRNPGRFNPLERPNHNPCQNNPERLRRGGTMKEKAEGKGSNDHRREALGGCSCNSAAGA
jgi:hypothetical protein